MTAPDPGLTDGQRTVGSNARVTAAAQALAARMWRGGSDEQYHFLLYLCAQAVETVLTVADRCEPEDEALVGVPRVELMAWANQMEAAANLVENVAGGTAKEALHQIACQISLWVVKR